MGLFTIPLYFDYKSAYSHLAKAEAYRLEEDYHVQLEWLPYVLDIPAALGDVETRTEMEWRKVRYSYLDARRWANTRGLLVRGPRKIFDSSLACMGGLYAMRQENFRPYHDAVFDRFWKRELDIEDRQVVVALCAEVGLDEAGFLAYVEGDGPRELAAIRERAEEDKVFGVPMFFVRGEPFWGNDRIDWVRKRLDELELRRR